ncbi:ankyrin repeat domain-containing protein [Wolbachia endosymbiont of Bemisia tabaci]|uniref:ankyrin repeat domain-containing protein n=1 Tax=Wolbachia endosymbiont of Bemisia tabaci TaxID=215173 RepID=UPI000D5589E0|nr:ankyrin repeat domain-containing protein [Wolbachia endosymbiont of Bemisia tabaci]
MFASIKQNYKSIEGQLGSVICIQPGMPLLLDLVDETIGRANSKAKLNRLLLLLAASKGNVVEINSMLANGIDVNARKNVTAHFAEALGNVFLYRETAYEPSYNLTPLHFAALNGHFKVVELLISKGADINAKDDSGLTPLHLASGGGYEEIVKLLSNGGADINAKDSNDVVPLHFAAEGGYLNIVQFLF